MDSESWMGEYPRVCAPWTEEEERVLIENFKKGATLKELCNLHGRKPGGINTRLTKLLGYCFYNNSHQTEMEKAQDLIAKGYRCISRKHCRLSRIDREDWVQVIATQMTLAVADYYNCNGGISTQWYDHYRRCHSKDVITVTPECCRHIPSSSGSDCGFIPI
jgi:hypothetical protein